MENTWENFWKSGSVDDYLAYCRNDRQAGEERNRFEADADGRQAESRPAVSRGTAFLKEGLF